MRLRSLICSMLLLAACPWASQGADIEWWSFPLEKEEDVSNFGTAVEAFAFTGDRDNNALPGTFPLEDAFDVNGTTFSPLNFTLGDWPEFLDGMTYDNGEFGHTEAEDGIEGLISGLAFQAGVNPQFLELTNLTVGQGYQVEFYYHHSTVDRTVDFDDGNGNIVTTVDAPTGSYASGYFVADGTSQEIISTANTGSHFLNGYQLREVSEKPPIPEPPDPPEPPVSIPALIGYWNFDDNTQDWSGKDNHGTISGGVEYDDDVPSALGAGKSANFDGLVDTHVSIEHNEMMPVTSHTDFTISMWVKGDGTSGDNNDDRIFSEGMSTNNNALFNLGTKNDGADATLDFFYRDSGGGTPGHLFSVEDAFDDEWHHVLWLDENNVGTLYIDGEEDSTFDYTAYPELVADITSFGSVLRAGDCCNFTGNIDDVSTFSFLLSDEEIAALASGESPLNIKIPGSLPGDYDSNGVVDAADADAQSVAMKAADPDLAVFDEDNNGVVNQADRLIWVHDHAFGGQGTWVGDSDLNGEFNSGDFVVVFTAGKYENGEMAGWAEGDWDGNMLFDSGDFVAAFTDGGYELGPQPGGEVAAVPEPSSCVLILLGLVGLGWCRRKK